MSYNDKKLNSIILAALLHDIGKAVQGSSHQMNTAREYSAHPGIGGRLVKKMFEDKLLDSADFEPETVSKLISYHHDDDIRNGEKELGDLLPLASLVSVADSYSSRERGSMDKSPKGGGNPRLRSMLTCIFSIIEGYEKKFYYRIGPLRQKMNKEILIPVSEEDTSEIRTDYDSVLKGLMESIKRLKNTGVFNYLSSIQGILEEYLWSVPSVTINEVNDISLYDHLSSSAAIAAALYTYHKENASLDNENAIRDENLEKFLLIAGDITGIQDFIFDINTLNAKGLSKELRGRSVLVSMIGSLISLKILKNLGLPASSKIIDAGGKFVILAPNTENTKNVLNSIYAEIIAEATEAFGGSLIPVIDWSQAFSASCFKDIKNVLKKTEISMAEAKLNKLSKGGAYYKCYRIENDYNDFLKGGKCLSCGMRPALISDGIQSDCRICSLAKNIGKMVVSEKICYINYGECGPGFLVKEDGFTLFGFDVTFKDDKISGCFYSEMIRCGQNEVITSVFRDISSHMPKANGRIDVETNSKPFKENTLCHYCQSTCDSLSERRIINEAGTLTFQCISSVTPMLNNGTATDHLVVLKGDVDDLGYIFSEGLGDKLSLSRYVYLSRMMNLFFTMYLNSYLDDNYPDIYTVYAGGDDFLLIGPWEEGIEAACGMREEFRKFTAENRYITLSVGISFFKPRQPVLASVNEADNMLEIAKKRPKKDSICIFDKPVLWDEMFGSNEMSNSIKKSETIKEIKDILTKHLKDSSLSMSGVYRILGYYKMYEEYMKTKKIEFLKYDYLLADDIKRNYPDNEELKKYLFSLKEEDKMKKLKIPLYWVIYKNRNKGGKNAQKHE